MTNPRNKHVTPSVSNTAFNCPHCGAFAKQSWFTLHADALGKDNTPTIHDEKSIKAIDLSNIKDTETRERAIALANRLAMRRPFIKANELRRYFDIYNTWISQCFNCNEIVIWVYTQQVWPSRGEAPVPNPDLPGEVLKDFEEAGSILELSPRGSAALTRLAIQKLCKHLGESGENINSDIGSLVRKGLALRVQQALDIVRVVGNNAVHPGQIDLRDDRVTAEKLLELINLIAEIMISQPKHVQTMFDGLPDDAKKAIENRDKK